MSASAGIIESIAKALSAISPASIDRHLACAGTLHAVVGNRVEHGSRACWPIASGRATVTASEKGKDEPSTLAPPSFPAGRRGAGGGDDAADRARLRRRRGRVAADPSAAADQPGRAAAADCRGAVADGEERDRRGDRRIRLEPRLSDRRPMAPLRTPHGGGDSGNRRPDHRHPFLREPVGPPDSRNPGRDPHLERGRGSAEAGRRLPARARCRRRACRVRGNRSLFHRRSTPAAASGREGGDRQSGGAGASPDQVPGRARADAGRQRHHAQGDAPRSASARVPA